MSIIHRHAQDCAPLIGLHNLTPFFLGGLPGKQSEDLPLGSLTPVILLFSVANQPPEILFHPPSQLLQDLGVDSLGISKVGLLVCEAENVVFFLVQGIEPKAFALS